MADYEIAINDMIEAAYSNALDLVASEINRRFDENDIILLALSNAREMELDSLGPLAELNRIQLPRVSWKSRKTIWSEEKQMRETIAENPP